jgi:hypothetical protein
MPDGAGWRHWSCSLVAIRLLFHEADTGGCYVVSSALQHCRVLFFVIRRELSGRKFHASLDYDPCQNLVHWRSTTKLSTITRQTTTRRPLSYARWPRGWPLPNVMKVERIVSSAKPPVAVTSKEWVLVFEPIFVSCLTLPAFIEPGLVVAAAVWARTYATVRPCGPLPRRPAVQQ